MVWVFDMSESRVDFREQDYGASFRWYSPKKSIWSVEAKMFWDFGEDQIFHVKKIYRDIPCGGYGKWIDRSDFLKSFECDDE